MKQILLISWIMWATMGLGYVALSYALLWERTKEEFAATGEPPEMIFRSDSRWVVVGCVAISIVIGLVCGPLSIFVWRLNFRPYD